jgi:hypothetical protein
MATELERIEALFLILSYGRSGSMLLAEKLGRARNSLPRYVKHPDQLADVPVQHSHLVLPAHLTSKFTRVFILRQDPVQTLLSIILAHHYQIHHRFKEQSFNFHPFEFTDWDFLRSKLEEYQNYHEAYSPTISDQDIVIFYEELISKLSSPDSTYLPLYTNKSNTILNYQQVTDFITDHKQSLIQSQQNFITTCKSTALCDYLNQIT